jgi:hypothetical protein
MSALASKLPAPADVALTRVRKGPSGECDIYGDGDLEDWAAVERLRLAPNTWEIAQTHVDQALGIQPIDSNKFRYHWRRKCWHWTPEQRRVSLEDLA